MELHLMEESTVETIRHKILEIDRRIHDAEDPERKRKLQEEEELQKEKERLWRKEELLLQLQIAKYNSGPIPRRRKIGTPELKSSIVHCKNFDLLKTAYSTLESDIEIMGPKGFGKSTALLWLYEKIKESEDVIFCDLLSDSLTSFDVDNKIVLLDNAQRSEKDDRMCLSKAKRYIAAFSPMSTLSSSHRLSSRHAQSLSLTVFTDDEAREFIKSYNHSLEESTVESILLASNKIPKYLILCMNKITLHINFIRSGTTSNSSPIISDNGSSASETDSGLNFDFLNSAVRSSMDAYFEDVRCHTSDISDMIIRAVKHEGESPMTTLGAFGIVYEDPINYKYKLAHPRYLIRAFMEKGLSSFSKHWHSLEELVMVLFQVSSTKIHTLPRNKDKTKVETIPKVLEKFVASGPKVILAQDYKEPVYAIGCHPNQKDFDIVVVNTVGKQAFFVQVSEESYKDHSKPDDNFHKDYIQELNKITHEEFTPFFVYATIKMQQYTKYETVYFMAINKKSLDLE